MVQKVLRGLRIWANPLRRTRAQLKWIMIGTAILSVPSFISYIASQPATDAATWQYFGRGLLLLPVTITVSELVTFYRYRNGTWLKDPSYRYARRFHVDGRWTVHVNTGIYFCSDVVGLELVKQVTPRPFAMGCRASPAGYYPDPWGRGQLRYWNRRTWTSEVLEAKTAI